ncbi:hypothetical protein [Chryseobacterium soli]|uniref:hypothetical protein n=1 Tax=Chryseobacterium soli TaxID=445961 RepID=UPI000A9B091B|nr:hypothetical protein [Chryseobacterium soli]
MKKITLPLLFAVFAVIPSSLFSQDNERLIKDYISQNKIREYKKSDLTNFIVDNVDNSKSLKGSVVKFQQMYNGLPIHSSVGTALVRDGKIVYYADNFIQDYTSSTSNNAKITQKDAIDKIADNLGKAEIKAY